MNNNIIVINVKTIGENSGTGNTLKNIFNTYPQNNIMQLCLVPKNIENAGTFPNTIFVTEKTFPIDSLVRRILHIKKKKTLIENNKNELPSAIINKSLKSSIHDCIRGLLDMSPVYISKDIYSKIEKFAPSVIYTSSTSIRNFKTVKKIAKRFNTNIIIHLMDDWIETAYTASLLSLFARKKMMKELNWCMNHSRISFVISETLGKKYSKLFKDTQFIELMNPARFINEKYQLEDKEVLYIVYAGALTLNRWKSVIDVAKTINNINKKKYMFNFTIYIPIKNYSKELIQSLHDINVDVRNYMPADKVMNVYNRADILLHIESFDKEVIPFTKHSLSTKIPEYMAAGKPILGYMPKELYCFNFIESRKIGLAADSIDNLKKCLFMLKNNIRSRENMGHKGIDIVMKEYSEDVVANKLKYSVDCSSNKNI